MIKEFYPAETIIGKRANAYRRDHEFDKAISIIINNNRSFLRKYLLWVDNTKDLTDTANATRYFIKSWNDMEKFAYIITDKKNNPVGSIDIQDLNLTHCNAKFGYFLGKEFTGNGYVSDILSELETMLAEKGIKRFQIECVSHNIESNNVAIRNGYVFEGTLKKAFKLYDTFEDLNIYGKTL